MEQLIPPSFLGNRSREESTIFFCVMDLAETGGGGSAGILQRLAVRSKIRLAIRPPL